MSLSLGGCSTPEQDASAANPTKANVEPTVDISSVELPELTAGESYTEGISRNNELETILPSLSRWQISTYTVQEGDTLSGIAETYRLNPSSILWANTNILGDNPHSIKAGQVLNILPVDGAYYQWHQGDGLNGVANYFKVNPEDIINWKGNDLTPETIGDYAFPNIEPGTWLIIPNGEREFINWSAPKISRDDPAAAKIYGPGYCGSVSDGAIGNGAFIWPTTMTFLSGYDYTPETNHWGIDVACHLGNPIYAIDSGVVVYAGWNDHGYGNVVVIDHGNGWQSLYAHLDVVWTTCGASVETGVQVANCGTTGNSTGPHLHFELMNASGYRVNPWSYISP
jgi:murein DD-endopeptidase MepM/ murein hydrolase activator NlpD